MGVNKQGSPRVRERAHGATSHGSIRGRTGGSVSRSYPPLSVGVSPKSVQRPTDMSRELRTVTTAARARPHFDFTMSIFPAERKKVRRSFLQHNLANPARFPAAARAVLQRRTAFPPGDYPSDGNDLGTHARGERGRRVRGQLRLELTRGEVDVGEEDDVGGDERDELGDADLLFEVDVDHVVVPEAAVGRRVELPQTGPQAAQEPETETETLHPAT